MYTKSPFFTLGLDTSHFCRRVSSGRYSRSQRLQKWFTINCTCRHRFRYWSLSFDTVQAYDRLSCNSSRWFGVSASSSLVSSLSLVIGRLLTRFSASQKTVVKISSLRRVLRLNNAYNTHRTVFIMRSQTPPMCDAWGGLNFQSTSWRLA